MKTKQFLFALMLLGYFGNLSATWAANHNVITTGKTEITTAAAIGTYSENSPVPPLQTDVTADFDEFPNLHPMVVHFPIVLLLLAVVLQLIQLFTLNRTMDWVILLTVGAGFIGAYVAGTLVHPHTEGLTEAAKKVLEHHDKYAMWTMWSSAIAALLKIVSLFWFKLKRGFEIGVFVIMAFAAYSVAQAGHYGSQLVYIEGVGPEGKYLGNESEEGHQENGEHSH